jgi:hypothetical protein
VLDPGLPITITAGDLDGDGDIDLARSTSGPGSSAIFLQEAPGLFRGMPVPLGGFDISAADLDADGDLDLASANLANNQLMLLLQEAPGIYSSTPLLLGNTKITPEPDSVAAADLDGDGEVDLVSTNENSLTVFFGGR